MLVESIESFDYSKVHDDPEANQISTIASIMPKLYFCVKQSLDDIVKQNRFKHIGKEDDLLDKALHKFLDRHVESRI